MFKSKLITSFRVLDPRKGNKASFVISLFMSGCISYYISNRQETIILLVKTLDILLSTYIGIFATFFTVYSVVLSFLQKKFLKHLLRIKEIDGYDYVSETIQYIENVAYQYCFSIILTTILKIAFSVLDESFVLFNELSCNIIASTAFLLIYYTFSFRVLFEFKSIIFNAILLLDGSIKIKLLEIKKGDLYD